MFYILSPQLHPLFLAVSFLIYYVDDFPSCSSFLYRVISWSNYRQVLSENYKEQLTRLMSEFDPASLLHRSVLLVAIGAFLSLSLPPCTCLSSFRFIFMFCVDDLSVSPVSRYNVSFFHHTYFRNTPTVCWELQDPAYRKSFPFLKE